MKNLFWELEAAIIREILHDNTSGEELRSNLLPKIEQATKVLEDKNPGLFNEFRNGNPSSFMSSFNEFMDELMVLVPKNNQQLNLFGPDATTTAPDPFRTMGDYIPASDLEGWDSLLNSNPNIKSEDCHCPDLLAGHHNGCVYGKDKNVFSKEATSSSIDKTPSCMAWRNNLAEKLGNYSHLAESATLFTPTIDQAFAAETSGLPHISSLEIGDLIYVEEKSEPRNVDGSFLGVVIDPEPSEDEDGNPGDYYDTDVSIVDSFGNKVSLERYWLGHDDQIIVLRRDGQTGPIKPTL